jgi:hypothetical protein
VDAQNEIGQNEDPQQRQDAGAEQRDEVGKRHVTPPAAIMPCGKKDGCFGAHNPRQTCQKNPPFRRRQVKVEAEREGQPIDRGKDRRVPQPKSPSARRQRLPSGNIRGEAQRCQNSF